MFEYYIDPFTGEQATNIKYTDPVTGDVWFVPPGHRIWITIYLPWLAAGNTPTAAS
jgi:hypothetical protein